MSGDDEKFATGSIDLLKIMMLTGAIVGVICVWQVWLSADIGITQFVYTGYDLFAGTQEHPDSGYFIYVPLVVLLISIAAVATSVLTFTKYERKGAVASTILGACMLASTLSYMLYPESRIWLANADVIWVTDIRLMDYLDGGSYSALIASIFLILGGLIVFFSGKKASKEMSDEL